MSRPPLPFYRSPMTRWAFIIFGAYLAFSLSFAPAVWRDTPSLRWLHTVLPWSLMAALFTAYVLMLLFGSLRIVMVADFFGLLLYGLGLMALLVTLRLDRPTNPFAIAGVALACVLHYQAGRLALIDLDHDQEAA